MINCEWDRIVPVRSANQANFDIDLMNYIVVRARIDTLQCKQCLLVLLPLAASFAASVGLRITGRRPKIHVGSNFPSSLTLH